MYKYQCTYTLIPTHPIPQYQATYLEAVHARRGLAGHGQGRGHGPPHANATAAVPRANATAAAPHRAPVTGAHPQGVPASHPTRRGVIDSGVSLIALRQVTGSIAAAGGSAAAAGGLAGGSGSGATDATGSGGGVAVGGGSGGGDVTWPGYIGVQPGYAGFQPGRLSDALDTSLPLPGVCATQSCWVQGAFVFALISASCLGFVIFSTSRQSFSGLCHMACPRRYSRPVCPTRRDELLGQAFLFVTFYAACGVIIAFFTIVPIYSAGEGRRDDGAWRQACDDNDVEALAKMGLS